jgi:hypothetical protein
MCLFLGGSLARLRGRSIGSTFWKAKEASSTVALLILRGICLFLEEAWRAFWGQSHLEAFWLSERCVCSWDGAWRTLLGQSIGSTLSEATLRPSGSQRHVSVPGRELGAPSGDKALGAPSRKPPCCFWLSGACVCPWERAWRTLWGKALGAPSRKPPGGRLAFRGRHVSVPGRELCAPSGAKHWEHLLGGHLEAFWLSEACVCSWEGAWRAFWGQSFESTVSEATLRPSDSQRHVSVPRKEPGAPSGDKALGALSGQGSFVGCRSSDSEKHLSISEGSLARLLGAIHWEHLLGSHLEAFWF